jgi:medium-chain acyl-[acyl-carrier-protein] hydrolase
MKSPWLPFGVGAGSHIRLLCLPHAGAGASAYRVWGAGLPPTIGVCPVQLPGRENRIGEKPYYDVESLVADLAAVVAERVEPPYALFGHSLGALVAFELAQALPEKPVHLFVSGRQAPHTAAYLSEWHDLPLPDLVAELAQLGGTPREVLDNPELLEMILPLLRADFSINENYRPVGRPPLDLPITAFGATADPRAALPTVEAWREQTSREFVLHKLPGGHFAVLQHASFVHARIVETMAPWTPALVA